MGDTLRGHYFTDDALHDVIALHLLFMGGIIGMSLVNSIFVDAMAADNNDEVLEKLSQLEKKLDKMESRKGASYTNAT